MGKGSGDRANPVAFQKGAKATGFPPESPTFRKVDVDKRVWLSDCCGVGPLFGLDVSANPVVGHCSDCKEPAVFEAFYEELP